MHVNKADFVGIPTQDPDRSREFYVEKLGLRKDENAEYDVWIGDQCFSIWQPEQFGTAFEPQRNAHPALNVDDVAEARKELEEKGVEFMGETFDTGVCHMALFRDPDGNDLMLHNRYKPYE